LQSFVYLSLPTSVSLFERYPIKELRDLFVTSSLSIGQGESVPDEVSMAEWSFSEQFELPDGQKGAAYVYATQDSKCPRCWRFRAHKDSENEDPLCGRCVSAVEEISASSTGA